MKTNQIIAAFVTVVFLASCTSTKFASRKYTKGYFVDIPSAVPEPDKKVTAYSAAPAHSIRQRTKSEVPKPVLTQSTERVSSERKQPRNTNLHSSQNTLAVNNVSSASPVVKSIADGGERHHVADDRPYIHSMLAIVFVGLPLLLGLLLAPLLFAIGYGAFIWFVLIAFVFCVIPSIILAIIALSKHERLSQLAIIALILDIVGIMFLIQAFANSP